MFLNLSIFWDDTKFENLFLKMQLLLSFLVMLQVEFDSNLCEIFKTHDLVRLEKIEKSRVNFVLI